MSFKAYFKHFENLSVKQLNDRSFCHILFNISLIREKPKHNLLLICYTQSVTNLLHTICY